MFVREDNALMRIEVYSWNRLGQDERVGVCSLSFKDCQITAEEPRRMHTHMRFSKKQELVQRNTLRFGPLGMLKYKIHEE
eukprot:84627-Amphidinium_carterae.1